MTGPGRRSAAALCATLAAVAAAFACARPASAAGPAPPPTISIVIDDGVTASDSAVPPTSLAVGETIGASDTALLRLALALAQSEGVAVADDPSFLLGILLQNGEPVSTTDLVKLLLGIQLPDNETVSGQDAIALLLGIRQTTNEAISVGDLATLLLGIKQTTNESIGVTDSVSAVPTVVSTSTSVASSAPVALAGSQVTYTAVVTTPNGPAPSGSVTFSVDGVAAGTVALDAGGVARLTTQAPALGSHTVLAAYGGTAAYAPSNATTTQGVWDFTLSLTPETVVVQRGQTATFTVTAALVQGSVSTGLPSLTLVPSEGTLAAQQIAVPGSTQLLVATGASDPPGGRQVTVDPLHIDQHGATAHVYVNDPPVPSAGGPYTAVENTPLTLHGSATDADGDTLTYTWDVGGTAATGPTPTITVPDGPATVPVTLKVCDDHGACATATTTLTVSNAPPTVTLAATPSPVNEGATFTLFATIKDSAADVAAGFAIAFDCGTGTFVASTAPSTTCPAVDDPGVTVRARVTDKDGGTTVATLAVPIRNVAPTVKITAPPPGAVVFVGTHVALGASFSDPGVRDTHKASFAVAGATVPASVTESGGSGTAAATWTPFAAGIDTLIANVTDNAGATGSASQTLIVVDPAGVTTGLGQIGPRRDRVRFTFEARYPRGATTPSGLVLVQRRGLVFRSTSLAWLVAASRKATLQGTGVVNGAGGYSFQLVAVDGRPNQFGVKIWKTSTGAVVLDTGAPQPLTGGDLSVRP